MIIFRKLLFAIIFLCNSANATSLIQSCSVEFDIDDSSYAASYEVHQLNGALTALYKSPFSDDVVTTDNVKVIFYDQDLVRNFFVGAYKEQMSKIGNFNGDLVTKIEQFGIEMNGNSAKAQILLFYDASGSELGKIAYPSYFPMKCDK